MQSDSCEDRPFVSATVGVVVVVVVVVGFVVGFDSSKGCSVCSESHLS